MDTSTPKGVGVDFKLAVKMIAHLRVLVREAGYHVVRLKAEGAPPDEAYSRSCYIYKLACDALREIDPNAEIHINATYNPNQQHGETGT